MKKVYLVCDFKKRIVACFDNRPAADDYIEECKSLKMREFIDGIFIYQVHSTVDELLAAAAKAEV